MTVADFMTRRVITVAPDAPLAEAAKLMLDHKISGLPVVDEAGHVVGIVSEHDLLRRRQAGEAEQRPHWLQVLSDAAPSAGEMAQFRNRTVNDVMTPNPVTIAANSSLKEASRLIEARGFKRLPVVQRDRLVGIIARADLVRALAYGRNGVATMTPDVSVTEQLRELERQNWRNRARVMRPF